MVKSVFWMLGLLLVFSPDAYSRSTSHAGMFVGEFIAGLSWKSLEKNLVRQAEFSTLSPGESEQIKINWRKIDTREEALEIMTMYVKATFNVEKTYQVLQKLEADQLVRQGDTLILYNSPFVPLRPLSLVSRTWMYTFTFLQQGLYLESIDAKEGLLGP